LVFLEFSQYLGDSLLVFFECFSKDDNLISKDVIHHGLKCRWGVCESEEHYQWFKQSLVCSEGCLPFITILDPDVIVAPSDIHF
ncbi:hypothetical protein AMATHDRAFT_153753, partial [Amanita thiersii Skay4041]